MAALVNPSSSSSTSSNGRGLYESSQTPPPLHTPHTHLRSGRGHESNETGSEASSPPPTTFCSTSLAQSPRPTLAVAKTLGLSRGLLPVLLLGETTAAGPPFGVFKPPGVGRVFAAIYAATATAVALRLPSGNSCGRGTAEARGGGDPQMGLRGRKPMDGNSRVEPCSFERGTIWVGF